MKTTEARNPISTAIREEKTGDAAKPDTSRFLLIAAWGMALFASILPEVMADQFFNLGIPWMNHARIAVFALLFLVTFFWYPIRPLRGFSAIWLVVYTGSEIISHLHLRWAFLENLLGNTPFVRQMQPEQFGKFALALGMMAYNVWQLWDTSWRWRYLALSVMMSAIVGVFIVLDVRALGSL
jgi:hypothetical protein